MTDLKGLKVLLDMVDTDNHHHTLTGLYLVIMTNNNELITILDEQSGEYFVINFREYRADIKFL